MPATSDITLTAIKPRFLYDTSYFDGATVTTNTEVSTLPATNLQSNIVRRPWRTAGDTQLAWAVYDLGSTQTMNMFGIFGVSNLTAGITIEGNDADSWGSPAFSVGMTLPQNADGVYFEKAISFAQGTYRYWRLTVEGSSVGSYWEIGRMVAGQYMEPSTPMELQPIRRIVDPSIIGSAEGRQAYSRKLDKYLSYTIEYQSLDDADRDKWEALFMNVGNTDPLIAAFNPTHTSRYHKESIYCQLVTPLEEALVQMSYGTLTLRFDELW